MPTDQSAERVIALLEKILDRLESVDTKLSAIQPVADAIAKNTSPLGRKLGDHADRADLS
jgi:hypothetical protein